MTTNRLGPDNIRGGLIALVDQLIDAVVRRDRWAIARRATGPLLHELLSGGFDDHFGAQSDSYGSVCLDGAPVVLVDDALAIVVAPVTKRDVGVVGAVTALLVRATGNDRPWFVASLTQDALLDSAFQKRVQHEQFKIDADLDIIAAHAPLDGRAASIDWDDDSVVLRHTDTGVVTVADARAEAANWPRGSWHWLAEECHTFAGLYFRGRHPELVREFPPSYPRGEPHE